MSATGSRRGSLAIVLHTHMPYVHGYGTWPSGEEWLWEVLATSWLPVSRLIEAGAPLTLSLTPVVGDQLEAADAGARATRFLEDVRRATHLEDQHWLAQKDELAGELAASHHGQVVYEDAIAAIAAAGGDVLGPLTRVARWTSAATHAVLPLLATEAGVRLQAATGIASHRRRCSTWGGGFWLPECAWDPDLEGPLVDCGVRSVCIEVPRGAGEQEAPGEQGIVPAPRGPWRTAGGLQLVPIDRPLMAAVWHHTGYPAHGAYRDSHRNSFNNNGLWANDGSAYDAERARAQARADAVDWAARCAARLDQAAGEDLVVAFDTELFGHWWHEGPWFLEAAVEALAAAGVELAEADELLARRELPVGEAPAAGTWGRGRDLSTWSAPAVAAIAWELRRAEIETLTGAGHTTVAESRLRDLLALQCSDWSFMVSEDRIPQYAWERFAGHARALRMAPGALPSSSPKLRHLAPDLARAAAAMG